MADRPIIAVCSPGEHFPARYVGQLFEIWCEALASGYGVSLFQSYSTYVHITRQNIARSVLSTVPNPAFLLWLDDDNLVSWAQVEKLLKLLESRPDVGIAAGWYLVKGPGGRICTSVGQWQERLGEAPAGFRLLLEEELPDDVFDAGATGFGCVLMRVETLQILGRRAFSVMADEDSEYGFMGEDFAFCLAAKKAGIKLIVDPSVQVPHLKLQPLESVLERVAV